MPWTYEHYIMMMYGNGKSGSDLPQSKLNDTIVRRIRTEHAAKEQAKRDLDAQYSAAAFAKRYGVGVTTIEKALSYETWRHVT